MSVFLLLFALVVVLGVRRMRKRARQARLAGLTTAAPVFQTEPPTRYLTDRRRERMF